MTKIILAYELLKEGVSKSHIAKHLGVSRRTIIRWSQALGEHTEPVPLSPSTVRHWAALGCIGIRYWGQFLKLS